MAVFKCKMCGGQLEIGEGLTVITCEYCGTQQTVPTATDAGLQNLFNRANTLRLKSEFDKAEQLYEKIVQADPTQAEAYWGMILCRYGIEYVEDPATYNRIPTCHRASFDSIIADEDYKAALQHADISQRALYEREAAEIDRIQKEILALSQKEEPYDVFICYKETDEYGKRTQDSVIANDIYYQLTREGLKVFYAAITLEGKLGSAYEPCIFAALNSAKVMLAIGTRPEYFNAVWVKNEWSRYLKLMKKDRSRLLIPCYRDMDAYDLPEEFAHLQAQDMSKIGFINDLVRGIKKVTVKEEEPSAPARETVVVNAAAASTDPLLKRVFIFLEDGDWTSANEYCEKVLDIDPENARAYLGKLMAELHAKQQEDLKNCAEPFESSNNYQKALRFADEELRAALEGDILFIKYTNAQAALSSARTENAYKIAAQMFSRIAAYKDSAALAAECLEKAEATRKDDILLQAKNAMGYADSIDKLTEAIRILQKIPGWRDADERRAQCEKRIVELKEQAERQAELHRIAEAARKKRNKRIFLISASAVAALTAFIVLLTTVIIPASQYKKAEKLLAAGAFEEAVQTFRNLDDYKDAADRCNECRYAQSAAALSGEAQVGDILWFGAHEQDNNTDNGAEAIAWQVLAREGDRILVISQHGLDCRPYHEDYEDVTWETCTLRSWLNDDFFAAAFTAEEQSMIPTVTVSAAKNPSYGTNPGNATEDKVFLLSIPEAETYFTSDSARQCKPTDYAVANGAYVNSDNGYYWWWLRSPGNTQTGAANVYRDGDIDADGYSVNYVTYAVRPAMWINLNS